MDEHFFYSGSGGTTIRHSTIRLRARHSHHGELSIRSGSGGRLTIPGAAVLPFDETHTSTTSPKQKRWSLTQLPTTTACLSPTTSSNSNITTASARRKSLQCILNRALSVSGTIGNGSSTTTTTTATQDQNNNEKLTEAARIAASIIKIEEKQQQQQRASILQERKRGIKKNDEDNDVVVTDDPYDESVLLPSTADDEPTLKIKTTLDNDEQDAAGSGAASVKSVIDSLNISNADVKHSNAVVLLHFARSNNNDVNSVINSAENGGEQFENETQCKTNNDDNEHFVQTNDDEQYQHSSAVIIEQVQNNDDSNAEQFKTSDAKQLKSNNAEQFKTSNVEQLNCNNAEQIIVNDNVENKVEQDSELPMVSLPSPSRTFSSEASSIDHTRMINGDSIRNENHDSPSSFISNRLVSSDSNYSINADDLQRQSQHHNSSSSSNSAVADYVSSLQNNNDRFLMDVSLSSTLTARTHTSVDITSLCSNPQDDCDWGGAIALSQMHEAGLSSSRNAVAVAERSTTNTDRPTGVVAREMEHNASSASTTEEGQRRAKSRTSRRQEQRATTATERQQHISSHDIFDTYEENDHDPKENSSFTFSCTSSRDEIVACSPNGSPSTTKIIEEDYDTLVQMLAETPSIFFDDYQIAESTQQKLLPNFDCMHPQAFEPYALGAALARESLEQLTMKQQQEEIEGEQSSSSGMEHYLDWNNYQPYESHEDDPMGIESTLGSSTVARQRERVRAAMRLYRRNMNIAENSRFRKYVDNLRYCLQESMKNKNKQDHKKVNKPHKKNKWMVRSTMRNLLMSVMVVNGGENNDNQGRGRDSVCLLGGVDILCQYVSQWNDIKSLELAVPILGCLADRHLERQAIIAAHCGVSHVLGCLRRHSSLLSPSQNKHSKRSRLLLEEECIITLYKMTSHNIENVSQLIMNLGVATLLEVMSQHQPNNIAIQKNTFGILVNVVKYDHTYVISQPNIFTMLVKSMERHKNSVALQHVAMVLFRQLSCFAVHHVEESSFLGTMEGSAQKKKNAATVQNDNAIDDSMMDDMIRSNVVFAILSGMRRHTQHTSLIQHGFATLHILCESRLKARKQLIEGNITTNLGSLMRLIQRHEQNVWIQRDSFKLLRSLRTDVVTSEGNNNVHSSSLPQTLLKDSKMMSILSRAGLHGKLYGTS